MACTLADRPQTTMACPARAGTGRRTASRQKRSIGQLALNGVHASRQATNNDGLSHQGWHRQEDRQQAEAEHMACTLADRPLNGSRGMEDLQQKDAEAPDAWLGRG